MLFYSLPSQLLIILPVDAHTAHHLYNNCLKGELMRGRTVILVSHHVQLCAPGAKYIVALDNGRVQFQGGQDEFYASGVINKLVQSGTSGAREDEDEAAVPTAEEIADAKPALVASDSISETTTVAAPEPSKVDKKPPRKLVEEEKRAVGRIGKDVWNTYLGACGQHWYWIIFTTVLLLANLSPIAEKGWVTYGFDCFSEIQTNLCCRYWAGEPLRGEEPRSPIWYIKIYAIVSRVSRLCQFS